MRNSRERKKKYRAELAEETMKPENASEILTVFHERQNKKRYYDCHDEQQIANTKAGVSDLAADAGRLKPECIA